MILSHSSTVSLALTFAGLATLGVRADELKVREQEAAIESALIQVAEAKANADQYRRTVETLTTELAAARRELATLKSNHAQLAKQAALVDQSTGSEALLQKRLIDALSDLGLMQEKSQQLQAENLHLKEKLISAGLTVNEPVETAEVEKSSFSKVVSFQPDLQLAVVKKSGETEFKVGAPVRFQRADRTCARGLVVEVREHIVGVLVTELTSSDDRPQIGDITHLEPNNI